MDMAIRAFLLLFFVFSYSYIAFSLYEDQVGLMDWSLSLHSPISFIKKSFVQLVRMWLVFLLLWSTIEFFEIVQAPAVHRQSKARSLPHSEGGEEARYRLHRGKRRRLAWSSPRRDMWVFFFSSSWYLALDCAIGFAVSVRVTFWMWRSLEGCFGAQRYCWSNRYSSRKV